MSPRPMRSRWFVSLYWASDGTVSDGLDSKAYIAGVTIIDVPSREEALQWAAKIAVACRCAQQVREFAPDPAGGN